LPLQADNNIDYEYNSEEEWANDPSDAENLDDSEMDEDEEETIDDEQDGFFVAHGYLSAGEGEDDAEQENLTPEQIEQRKARFAAKEAAFQASVLKKSKTVLAKKPKIYGFAWGEPDPNNPIAREILSGIILDYKDIDAKTEVPNVNSDKAKPKSRSKKKKQESGAGQVEPSDAKPAIG